MESNEQAAVRWRELEALQAHYKDFRTFLYDVMTSLLGFNCSWLQLDIASFLQFGPTYIMIQAQRGQAKTTITAAYAVWRLIHAPTTRVLIVSSTEDMASEISNWVIQIIRGMPELECLMPDMNAGDRCSVKAFDIHHSLKGAEKSPSIKCRPITGSLSGNRADILIADDIETPKNSQTEAQREILRFLTKEFTSICSTGRIIYLGTPQSIDSIYNSLPARGYTVRIWPGRYPTVKEEQNYQGLLAPMIVKRMQQDPCLREGGGVTGDRGQVTDSVLLDEETLCKKERDQGPAYFQLQHMLDTRLMDAARYPLKPERLIVAECGERAPCLITSVASENNRFELPAGFPIKARLYRASRSTDEHTGFIGTHMFIDPAGGGANADETGYAVTKAANGYIHAVEIGGVKGGLDTPSLQQLVEVAKRWKPDTIGVEKNYGNGMYAAVLMPMILKEHKCGLDEPWNTGQKESRVIGVLEPLLGNGKLIIDPRCIEEDWASVQQYSMDVRAQYSWLYQLLRITKERGALLHDDRLEALAMSCLFWVQSMAQDGEVQQKREQAKEWYKKMRDPLGEGRDYGLIKPKKNSVMRRLSVRR